MNARPRHWPLLALGAAAFVLASVASLSGYVAFPLSLFAAASLTLFVLLRADDARNDGDGARGADESDRAMDSDTRPSGAPTRYYVGLALLGVGAACATWWLTELWTH